MNAVGLVVEYNPFHNGHYYHLQQSKKITGCDTAIAVMSGHFLQRGEPALLDKWTRAEMALANGCDLVLELPVIYATSSAEWFAYGAVATLQATGVVRSLCFGSESGNIEQLQLAAQAMVHEQHKLHPILQEQLKLGISYPQAFNNALNIVLAQHAAWSTNPISLDQPNHTLGLHYLVALERLQSSITPYTISRQQAQYHDITLNDSTIASATAIRKTLLEQLDLSAIRSYVPKATYNILQDVITEQQITPAQWNTFASALFYQLAIQPAAQLALYREMEEGLQFRFIESSKQLSSYSVSELIQLSKTKRYTHTKLQRALLAVLLQHRKELCSREALTAGIQYIRVLGFNEKGKQLLKQMKHSATVPVIHKPQQYEGSSAYLELDIAATRCYMQFTRSLQPKAQLADFLRPPVIR